MAIIEYFLWNIAKKFKGLIHEQMSHLFYEISKLHAIAKYAYLSFLKTID